MFALGDIVVYKGGELEAELMGLTLTYLGGYFDDVFVVEKLMGEFTHRADPNSMFIRGSTGGARWVDPKYFEFL